MKFIYATIAMIFLTLAGIFALLLIPSKKKEPSTVEAPKKTFIKKTITKKAAQEKPIKNETVAAKPLPVVEKKTEVLAVEETPETPTVTENISTPIETEKAREAQTLRSKEKSKPKKIEEEKTAVAKSSSSKKRSSTPRKFNPNKKRPFRYLASKTSFDKKKEGFVIVTTNDLTHRMKALPEFIYHKATKMNFRMYVATEDDFGKGIGRTQAFKIRAWLQENYKKLNLKYAILIGNGHPEEGDIPMIKAVPVRKPTGERWEKLSDEEKAKWRYAVNGFMPNTGQAPTDYFYVDLQGDWDLDKDTIVGSAGDYAEGGITGQANLLVGRIPYYGEGSEYGKAQDMDIILRRSIRYDNEKDIKWRYNFTQLRQWDMIPNEVFFERDVLEKHGINYFRDKDYQDTIGFPAYHYHHKGDPMAHNVAKLARIPLGFTRLGGHGSPTGMHGINSGQVRRYLNDSQPTVINMGGCDVGKIEHPYNLAYTLLRFQAIATHGGTRSVTGAGGNRSKPYVNRLLEDGKTVGEAWWGEYNDKHTNPSRRISATAFLINVYGDPTVKPFPTGLKVPYPFIAKPVKPYHVIVQRLKELKSVNKHELKLTNNTNKTLKLRFKSMSPWYKVSRTSLSLSPNETRSIETYFDPIEAKKLSPGVHETSLLINDGRAYTDKRLAYLEIPDGTLISRFRFDNENNKGFKDDFHKSISLRLKEGENPSSLTVEGIRGKALNTSQRPIRTGLDSIPGPNTGSYSFGFWMKKSKESQKSQILNFTSFFKIETQDDKVILTMNDFNWYGRKRPQVFSESFKASFEQEWSHIAVVVDQIQGQVDLYQNAKHLGTMKTAPQLLLAPKFLNLGKFNGALDDFVVYRKTLTALDVKKLWLDVYVEAPSPKHKERNVIPGDVDLKFLAGSKVKDLTLVLSELSRGTSSNPIKITADDKGQFIAKNLKANSSYTWHPEYSFEVNGKTKKVKGEPWYFSTSKTLIENGDFEKSNFPWRGDVTHHKNVPNRALEKSSSMGIEKGGEAIVKASELIKEGFAYKLKFIARSRWKKGIHYEFFYKGHNGDEVLAKKIQDIFQDRHGNNCELDFFALPKRPYIGKELYVRIKSDAETGDYTWVDKVILLPYRHNSRNKNPKLIKDLEKIKATAEVENNLFSIRLTDLVNDPEGSPMTFEKVDGPEWIRVRGQELMTNFGPTSKDLGLNKVTVIARDAQGGSVKFTVPITVNKRSSKEINLLPFKAEVKGPRKAEKSINAFREVGHQASWKESLAPNAYQVQLLYKCNNQAVGSLIEFSFRDTKIEAEIKATPFQAKTITLGKVNLNFSGENNFTLKLKTKANDKMSIDVIRVILKPIK